MHPCAAGWDDSQLMYNIAFINRGKLTGLATIDAAFGPESRKADDAVKLEDVLDSTGVKLR
jgi:hypothetical protein